MGGNLAMNAMIDGYHNAGKQVYVLAMHTTRHPVSIAQLDNLYKHAHGFSTVDIDNRVRLLPALKNFLFSKQPNHAERFYHFAFMNKLSDVIAIFRPDVIQIESIFLSTYIPYIRQRSDAILVLRVHNIEYQVWQSLAKGAKNSLKRYYLTNLSERMERFEAKAWQDYDLLLPITSIDEKVIHSEGADTPCVVAPYGFEVKNISPSPDEKWEAYHIGAMDWLPNAEAMNWFLNDVWPGIHAAFPSFRFSFAGRYMPDKYKNANIAGVFCAGEVADADAFIAEKKILIVPLKSGGGIRIKILEAMAAGKVVISTDMGMQGIEATPGMHYLAANKPEDFVEAIKWCLENKYKAELISENAIALIRDKYEQRSIMKRVIDSIERL